MTGNARPGRKDHREALPQTYPHGSADCMTGIDSIVLYWLVFIGTMALGLILKLIGAGH